MIKTRFVVASKNRGKLKEIKEILKDFPFEVMSMEEVGINEEIEETGITFEENAQIKARALFEKLGTFVLADDSGLEVDELNGAPGIYSARYGGEGATDEQKNLKLLDVLKNVPLERRGARFVCAIAVIAPNKDVFTVRGTCEGQISFEQSGTKGFGYDPVFYVPEYKMNIAEMNSELKNSISHRAQALNMMIEILKNKGYK